MAVSQAVKLFEIFQRNRERELVTDARTGEMLTYGQLLDRLCIMASCLAALGVERGEAVVFAMENGLELAVFIFRLPAPGSSHPADQSGLPPAQFRKDPARQGAPATVHFAGRLRPH